MRGRLLVTLVVLLASGCAQPSEAPGEGPAPQDPVTDHPAGVVSVTTQAPGPDGQGGDQTLRFDQANLSYEDQVQRFLLTADVPTDLRIDWDAVWVGVTWRPACMAGSVLHQQADSTRPLLSAAAWSIPSHLGVEVRVAGRSFQTQTLPAEDQGAGAAATLRAGADVFLEAGESVLIALGGTTPEAFHWDNHGGERSRSEMTVQVDGRVHLQQLEPRGLACGVGPRGAENGTAGASFYLVDVEAGGSVGLTSRNASTAWIAGQGTEGPAPVLHFLDDPPREIVEEVRRGSPRAGGMALEFPASAGTPFDHPAWLFLDDDWVLAG